MRRQLIGKEVKVDTPVKERGQKDRMTGQGSLLGQVVKEGLSAKTKLQERKEDMELG